MSWCWRLVFVVVLECCGLSVHGANLDGRIVLHSSFSVWAEKFQKKMNAKELVFCNDLWLKEESDRRQSVYRVAIRIMAEEYELTSKEVSVLEKIAETESTWRQFNDKGEVLRGKRNRQVVGLFQIHIRFHKKRAQELGYDIFTPHGNIAFGVCLFVEEGLRPWRTNRSLMVYVERVRYICLHLN